MDIGCQNIDKTGGRDGKYFRGRRDKPGDAREAVEQATRSELNQIM